MAKATITIKQQLSHEGTHGEVQQHYPVDVLKNSAKLSINKRRSTTYCGCTHVFFKRRKNLIWRR
jgi:hypothetical protein